MKGARKIILIPTYNEKDNILGLLSRLTASYPDTEVWVIDDNSPDGTGAAVESFAKGNTSVRLIKREKKNGLGEAYKHALRIIQGMDDVALVLTMDADGSHDSASVAALFSALEDKDMAIGSRYVKGGAIDGWDRKRLLLSSGGNLYIRLLTGIPIRDSTAGFVAYRKAALDRLDLGRLSSAGYSYQIEFKNAMLESGSSYTEVPITFHERRIGSSKVSFKIVAEGLLTPFHIFFQKMRKLRLRSWIAAALILATVFFAFFRLTESPSVWYDEGLYIQMADHISQGEPSGFQTAPGKIENVSKVSVGYPLTYPIALLFRIFGYDIATARVFMAACIILLVIFSYLLARRSFAAGAALFSLALVSMFPPLYGNGKSVLGEVPGILYLVISLYALNRGLKGSRFALVLAGVFAGLSAVTKPIFILIVPAFVIALFVARKSHGLRAKDILVAIISAAAPVLVWIVTQFGMGDSFREIVGFYANPQPGQGILATLGSNLAHIFSDFGLLYLVIVMAVWIISFIVRRKSSRAIGLVEAMAFTFSLLIVLAYLRTAGYNRYLFPAQMISLIYFPEAISWVFSRAREKLRLSPLFQSTLVPLGVLLLFVAGIYQLMFNSWVADSYSSHKTEFWQEYFTSHDLQNVLFYDVPEVAIFARNPEFYQYILMAPASGINVGSANLVGLKEGTFDTVIMTRSKFEDMGKDVMRHYREVGAPYKYVILDRKPL